MPIRRLFATAVVSLLLPALLVGMPAGGDASRAAEPVGPPAPEAPAPAETAWPWIATAGDGERRVVLWFFQAETCPHCAEAAPAIRQWTDSVPWLILEPREVTGSVAGRQAFAEVLAAAGTTPKAVPTFAVCGRVAVGWDSAGATLSRLREWAATCQPATDAATSPADPPAASGPAPDRGQTTPSAAPPEPVDLPFLGRVGGEGEDRWSLAVLTVALAAVDAFNPCAFFVLLFLLSLMVNARSRRRMALVGGIFVATSAAVYFVFLAAWLNLWLLLSGLAWMTRLAGVAALAIAVLDLRDALRPGASATLAIPDRARPGLFARMRNLVGADRLAVVLVGAATLAVVANAYEVLCTAGFPMVFTGLLADRTADPIVRYGWLGLYVAVYVLPMAAIVAGFVATLGRRKLTEREGRLLRLLSGTMMGALGLVLLAAPALLAQPATAVGLVALAVLATAALARLDRRRAGSRGGGRA